MSKQYAHALTLTFILLQLSPIAWPASFRVIHNFQTTSANPSSGLVFDSAGNAYGITGGGGHNNAGTIYQISSTGQFQIIYAFSGPDGKNPYGDLAIDSSGNLFGVTYSGGEFTQCNSNSGCGTIFRLSPPLDTGEWVETTLYNFSGTNDGFSPLGGVILDAQGYLYGTAQGGEFNCGLVFSLTTSGNDQWVQNVLYSFIGDGCNPRGTLSFDASGNLYGTTPTYGIWNGGNVFELSPLENNQWTFNPIYEFNPNIKDGTQSYAGVMFDTAGNLYGTTYEGGAFGNGTVFELTNNLGVWKESIIHHFTGGSDGANPYAPITLDSEGNVLGSTVGGGGKFGHGTLFELSPGQNGQWNMSVFLFTGNAHGQNPQTPLVFDSTGHICGTTGTGGPTKDGVAFRITP